jgi:hypothetical protein
MFRDRKWPKKLCTLDQLNVLKELEAASDLQVPLAEDERLVGKALIMKHVHVSRMSPSSWCGAHNASLSGIFPFVS